MGTAFRILIVEDFEPFRLFVRSTVRTMENVEVVGEAADGVEAIEKAKHLQPDLVLLDIGLPKLNGMAAAEQIRILAPQARLLFVSLECSSAVVRAAFRLGAQGYIYKLRAASDLMPGIKAVLAGDRFLGCGIDCRDILKTRRHEVQFYSDESIFLECAARFVSAALKADGAAITFVTKPHQESLVQRLQTASCDIKGALRRGTYISVDARVPRIAGNGQPDRVRFFQHMCSLIESAAKATAREHPYVGVFGECSALLCAEGDINAAIELENSGGDGLDADILCAYPLSVFQGMDDDRAFKSICAAHTAVFTR